MKHAKLPLLLTVLCLGFATAGQAADCYADYKARRDKPYELHYGVMKVATCSKNDAADDVRKRLARNGWDLLNIVSVFDESGLAGRKDNAGPYYLRF